MKVWKIVGNFIKSNPSDLRPPSFVKDGNNFGEKLKMKEMNLKISVIMPVYNTEKYLGEAIESILNQNFKDFEFIIIDDCSIDRSYEICEEYSKKDERIKLFRNEKNMGISFTRNKLISLSATNYIATQDSDDISLKNRLKLCFDFLENNSDYGVVSGDNIIINETSEIIGYRKYSDNIKNVILKKSPISQGSSLFRKNIFGKLGGYDKNINIGEDYDLWLKMYSKGYRIKNLDNNLYQVRIRKGQTKSELIKQTIKNTLFIQNRAIKKYNLQPNFSDKIYHLLEKILLFFPSKIIFWLFTKIEYERK